MYPENISMARKEVTISQITKFKLMSAKQRELSKEPAII